MRLFRRLERFWKNCSRRREEAGTSEMPMTEEKRARLVTSAATKES